MGRPKGFTREEVLLKAIPLFWQKGLAEATLQDLEKATGVNKSGLYREFKDKDDIFLESLRYYLKARGTEHTLSSQPKGWANIESYLESGQTPFCGRRGCFSVNSLRDLATLPPRAKSLIEENQATIKRLLMGNIKAELPKVSNPAMLADMTMTFYAGLCIEQNAQSSPADSKKKISSFLSFLQDAK
jgi:TetR/AcrR family transcriptional regulator, copper-responsive repressor